MLFNSCILHVSVACLSARDVHLCRQFVLNISFVVFVKSYLVCLLLLSYPTPVSQSVPCVSLVMPSHSESVS